MYIYLAGDMVVVQLSPLRHQQNSMLETVNTCMTSVYICVLPSIIYKFSSLTLFDAWLLDNVCVPPRCSWRVERRYTHTHIHIHFHYHSYVKEKKRYICLSLLFLQMAAPPVYSSSSIYLGMPCTYTSICICHLIIFQL